jgi:hypothetical protein
LDDIHVVDLEDHTDVIPTCDFETGSESFQRSWTSWPTGQANTVGKIDVRPGCGRDGSAGLRVQIQAPPDGRWPDFHLYHLPSLSLRKGHRYRVSLWVRAKPARKLTVAFYRPGQTFTFLGGPAGPFVNQIKMAAEVGVNFVSFPVSRPWPRPGQEALGDLVSHPVYNLWVFGGLTGVAGTNRWKAMGAAGIRPKGDDHFKSAFEPWRCPPGTSDR